MFADKPGAWFMILSIMTWNVCGYSGGAPEAACPTQQPQHGFPPSPCCEGFSLRIPSATSWSAGQTIEIQLVAANTGYEGVMLSASDIVNGERQGNFLASSSPPYPLHLVCDDTNSGFPQAITHSDSTTIKDTTIFYWVAPTVPGAGTVSFSATVVVSFSDYVFIFTGALPEASCASTCTGSATCNSQNVCICNQGFVGDNCVQGYLSPTRLVSNVLPVSGTTMTSVQASLGLANASLSNGDFIAIGVTGATEFEQPNGGLSSVIPLYPSPRGTITSCCGNIQGQLYSGGVLQPSQSLPAGQYLTMTSCGTNTPNLGLYYVDTSLHGYVNVTTQCDLVNGNNGTFARTWPRYNSVTQCLTFPICHLTAYQFFTFPGFPANCTNCTTCSVPSG